jgi:hypothetical protein
MPGIDRIVVSSQSGKLRVYNAETYALLKTLDFGTDADTDNMRYDPLSKKIYVGYGRGRAGHLRSLIRRAWNGRRTSSSAAIRNRFS